MPVSSIYKEIGAGQGLLYAWFSAMHTRVDLVITGRKEAELKQVVEVLSAEIESLEKIASFYDSGSELYQLNRSAGNIPVRVSSRLFEMILQCTTYYEKTQGYFDITIQSDNHSPQTIREVKLFPETQSIFLGREGIRLDLSGYLKGYALDKIHGILSGHGIDNALINMGNSSVMALGNHPFGEGWKVGYGNQLSSAGEKSVQLHDECYTTSGNETSDRKHIIDPKTGDYIDGIRKFSVVSRYGTDGEVLSTACLIAPENDSVKILDNFSAGGVRLVNN